MRQGKDTYSGATPLCPAFQPPTFRGVAPAHRRC